MYDKISGITRMNSNKGNGKNIRGGGGGNRHLSNKKNRNTFGFAGSNSQNWRENAKTNNVSELNTNAYKNHHLTSAFVSLIGLPVEIQKTDGHVYEGILESVSDKLEFHLCHASQKPITTTTSTNNHENDKLMFQFSDIVRCVSKNVDLEYAKRNHLMTDTAISGGDGGPHQERELVQWKPDHADKMIDSLEALEMNGTGGWEFDDMIRQNEEKHGLTSTFDSSMSNYMTPMEIKDDEEYRQIERLAEKTAREMQKDHRHKELDNADSGMNEEELFSSVVRPQQNSNSGTTPHVHNTNNTYNNNNNNPAYPSNRNYNKVNPKPSKTAVPAPRFRNQRNQEDSPNRNTHSQGPGNRIPNGVGPRHQQHHAAMHGNLAAAQQYYPNITSYSAAAKKLPNNMSQHPRVNNQQQQQNPPLTKEPENTNTYQHVPRVMTQEQLHHAKQQYLEKPKEKQPITTHQQQPPSNNVPPTPMTSSTAPIVTCAAPFAGTTPSSATQTGRQPIVSSNRVVSPADSLQQQNSPLRTNLEKKILPEQKPDVITDLPSKERGDLMKFGRLNKADDEKNKIKDVSIDDLKEFKHSFKLDSKGTKKVSQPPKSSEPTSSVPPSIGGSVTTSTTTTSSGEKKTALVSEAPIVQVSEAPTHAAKPSIAVDRIVTTSSHGTVSKTVSLPSAVLAPSTATVPVVSSTNTTSSSLKSTLNPSAKAFNPNAKEFTPTAVKSPLKQVNSVGESYVAAQPVPTHYHQQMSQPVIMNTGQPHGHGHGQEMPAHQYVPQGRPHVYRPHYRSIQPGSVYEVPNSNQVVSNQQPHPTSYMQQQQQQHHQQQQQQQQQHQHQQQQQVYVIAQPPQNSNMYPQPRPMMSAHQSFLPMQQVTPQMLRIVHGPHGQPVHHAGFQHDASGYMVQQGNQHSTPTSHQTVGGNYQPALSSPATTPHMPQSPYSGNAQQVNTSHYPQHIPTQFNTQAKADHYQARQAYPTNVQHHQQPFVMVHQGQQFVQGFR